MLKGGSWDYTEPVIEDISPVETKKENGEKYVVVHFEGGLGKHVAGTAVLEGVRKKYLDRKIILVCGYPEIFLYNPYVDLVYAIGNTPYFYDTYIKDKDVIVLKHDPYATTEHIKQNRHLIESWYEAFDLTYQGEQPVLFHNYRYIELLLEKYKRDKPTLLLHTNGGPYSANNQYDPNQVVSWSRDMPRFVVEKLVAHYSKDYHIFQVCKSMKNVVPGTEAIINPTYNIELLSLVRIANKRILIDSCLQHSAASFKLPSTVLWCGTNPKVFGYPLHSNITPKKEHMPAFKNITAYLYDFELWGNPMQCPYDSNDFFDVAEIIAKTDAQP